jgi:hyperosmotically inducible periplasmic protein
MTPNPIARTLRPVTLGLAALALAALAACSDDPGQTVGQQLDETVRNVESTTAQAGDRLTQEAEQARRHVGAAVDDARITAQVNAQLARDTELNALRIDVDTAQGRVVLVGVAPSEAARERAAALARAVDGVTEVDNRLAVTAG